MPCGYCQRSKLEQSSYSNKLSNYKAHMKQTKTTSPSNEPPTPPVALPKPAFVPVANKTKQVKRKQIFELTYRDRVRR